MKELVFALQFKGKARPVAGVEGKMAAKTTASGQVNSWTGGMPVNSIRTGVA